MAQPAVLQEEERQEIEIKNKKTKRKRVPKELIYEMRHGKPIYYRDYDKVLSGEKTLEEVMGSSFLQSWLVMIIAGYIYNLLDKTKYLVLTNELGFKFAPRSWRNLDIAIFKKEKIKQYIEMEYNQYVPIAPEVVIEIDTKADLRKFSSPIDYFVEKTEDLLQADVQKVIWLFTKVKKIWVAEKGKDWRLKNWNEDIEVIEGITINVQKMLEENK